jgi:hypothetical protein
MVGTMGARVRQSAVGLANQQIEQIRGTAYASIMTKAGTTPAPPASFTDDAAKVFTTTPTLQSDGSKVNLLIAASAAACPNCIVYQPPGINAGGHSFTVTQVVLAVDDASDSLAPTDTVPIDYKRAIVQVSSVRPAFTYTAQTIIHDVTNDPVTPVQGIQVEIHDEGSDSSPDNDWDGDPSTTNDLVSDDSFEWSVTIPEAGVDGAMTEEGTYTNFALEPGPYTVTVANTDDSKDWYPSGLTTAQSETFTCTVTTKQVTTCSRKWLQRSVCLVAPGQTGKLWIKVLKLDPLLPDGFPLENVTIDPAPLPDLPSSPDPAPVIGNGLPATGQNGDYIWDATLPVGPYNVSASLLGFQTRTQQTCVTPQDRDTPHLTFTLVLNPIGATSIADVTLLYTGGGNQTFVVNLVGTQSYEQQQLLSKNVAKVYHFTPLPGTYTISVSCLKKGTPNLKDSKLNQSILLTPAYTTSFTLNKC